eukprot:scaffold35584_cov176-Amphora_coffeaeformis.AAC.2
MKLIGRPLIHPSAPSEEAIAIDSNKANNDIATVVVTGPILKTNVSLSFWGGIDPVTGIIIDQQHPLVGTSVTDTIFCLPSGRGSCTASQVLLELILNGIAPQAILLRDADGLVAVGALVAQEIFAKSLPILCMGDAGFDRILESTSTATHAAVVVRGLDSEEGQVYCGTDPAVLQQQAYDDITAEERTINAERGGRMSASETFSPQEECLLANATNPAERMALRVIFRYARIVMDSPVYTSVTKAHIDGCTYIGPGGLDFVHRIVQQGGRVAVPTTLNSMSTDRRRWQALGVPQGYAKNAIALGDAYLELGCSPSFTCAPYLLEQPPMLGEDLVWGESNAVVYANSVLGARTEKYADYLDICGAIAGIVPKTGAHVPENRIPQIVLDAQELFSKDLSLDDEALDLDALFPVLGHLCGSLADGKVPILIGLGTWSEAVTTDHLKAFCAAYGTTGTSPLIRDNLTLHFHADIAGITPEAKDDAVLATWVEACTTTRALVTLGGLSETYTLLDKNQRDEESTTVDLVALGNPHLSVSECGQLAAMVKEVGGKKRDDLRIIGCISREVYQKAQEQGYIQPLLDFGVETISDTCWCMLLDPPVIPANPQGVILTNSGKYAHYGPGLTNRRFRFAGTRDCIEVAATGTYPKRRQAHGSRPTWLTSLGSLQRRSYSMVRTLRSVLPR